MCSRQTMLVETEARLPYPSSARVRPRVSSRFRMGASGAGAKVEKNVEKKESIYLSHKREPLGKPSSGATHWRSACSAFIGASTCPWPENSRYQR